MKLVKYKSVFIVFSFFIFFFILFLPVKIKQPGISTLILYNKREAKFYIKSKKIKVSLKKYISMYKNKLFIFDNTLKLKTKYIIPPGYNISIGKGEKGFILYNKESGDIKFINTQSINVWQTNIIGIPIITKNEKFILILTTESAEYMLLDLNGKRIKLRETDIPGLMTCFDVSYYKDFISTGGLNGAVTFYQVNGKIKWRRWLTNDSEIPVIKSVAVSSYGNYLAVLGGIKDEYLYIFDKVGDLINKTKTEDEKRRYAILRFSMNEEYIVGENSDGFSVYNRRGNLILRKKLFAPSLKRKIYSMDISPDGEYVIVAYKYNNLTVIEIYNLEGRCEYRQFVESKDVYVEWGEKEKIVFIDTPVYIGIRKIIEPNY